MNITDSSLSGNSVGANPGNGGGFHATGNVEVNITGSKVTGNSAAAEGGGLWNNVGTMTVDSTVVRNNTASGDDATNGGGGIYQLPQGTLVIQNGSSIVGNSADGESGSGGGVFNENGTLTINDSELVGNDANRAGGAIEMIANDGDDDSGDDDDSDVTGSAMVDNVLMSGNSAGDNPGNGGAVHFVGDSDGTVTDDTFTGADGSLVDSTAANEGGGVWNNNGEMTIGDADNDVSFDGNTAGNDGDNAYHEDDSNGTLVFNGTTVAPDTGV